VGAQGTNITVFLEDNVDLMAYWLAKQAGRSKRTICEELLELAVRKSYAEQQKKLEKAGVRK